MPSGFQLSDFLISVAPDDLCDECIGDRVPLSTRSHIPTMLSELKPADFERSRHECASCGGIHELTHYIGILRTETR